MTNTSHEPSVCLQADGQESMTLTKLLCLQHAILTFILFTFTPTRSKKHSV